MKSFPINPSHLISELQAHVSRSEEQLYTHHPHAAEIFSRHGIHPTKLRQHAARIAASSLLAGAMLLSGPIHNTVSSTDMYANYNAHQREQLLANKLSSLLPPTVGPLTTDQEQNITDAFQQVWGIHAVASLDNERLNRSYGLIGAEQHLPRYPGDTIDQHTQYQQSGITPGKGAWGYFANSQQELTNDLVEKEKYYVAVQTLYLPDWQERLSYLRNWYKYRKVLVVNTINGKTIVCDIADSGPSNFTGKHFGGSPEVMAYLGLNVGMQKGPVILFFLDDKDNSIPLGPVEYNISVGKPVAQQ